jgi:hypothetical protein
MSTNNIEFADLRNAGEMRAWLAANGCPERIATLVIERRTNEPGFQQAQPAADTGALDKVRAAAIL